MTQRAELIGQKSGLWSRDYSWQIGSGMQSHRFWQHMVVGSLRGAQSLLVFDGWGLFSCCCWAGSTLPVLRLCGGEKQWQQKLCLQLSFKPSWSSPLHEKVADHCSRLLDAYQYRHTVYDIKFFIYFISLHPFWVTLFFI